MITYNWKAEFSQKELLIIALARKVEAEESLKKTVLVIREMANALDRYEDILNEMEETNKKLRRILDGARDCEYKNIS